MLVIVFVKEDGRKLHKNIRREVKTTLRLQLIFRNLSAENPFDWGVLVGYQLSFKLFITHQVGSVAVALALARDSAHLLSVLTC